MQSDESPSKAATPPQRGITGSPSRVSTPTPTGRDTYWMRDSQPRRFQRVTHRLTVLHWRREFLSVGLPPPYSRHVKTVGTSSFALFCWYLHSLRWLVSSQNTANRNVVCADATSAETVCGSVGLVAVASSRVAHRASLPLGWARLLVFGVIDTLFSSCGPCVNT